MSLFDVRSFTKPALAAGRPAARGVTLNNRTERRLADWKRQTLSGRDR